MNLDDDSLSEMKRRARAQIRQRMRQLRRALPLSAIDKRSASIAERLLALQEVESAHRVALYWPLLEQGEVDVRLLDSALRARGASIYYPCIRDELPALARVEDPERDLSLGVNGFLEPRADLAMARGGEVDLLVVPALAVSSKCERIGYGGGFYDRLLPQFRPPARAILVAYDFQLLAEIPTFPHDVACDVLVTDERVLSNAT